MTNLPMNPFITFLLLQFILFLNMSDRVASQTLSDTTDGGIPPQDSSLRNNFQPSLAVVIGMLAVMFSLTFVLLLYAKFCHRATSVHNTTSHHQIQDGLPRTRGVDKVVVESLPFFRFSSLRGSKQGLECSVCLAKFRDVEVLRLLPKCKHAFHMDCIDQWLEKHATCPLCRWKVSADDLQLAKESASWRFLFCQSELNRDGSNLELYVEREESRRHGGSSRFSIGTSFRKLFDKEDELPIQRSDDAGPLHHKFKHRITVASDVMLKSRWSDLTSSDLMFLNSELLCDASSARFPSDSTTYDEAITSNIKAEMERKREFESRVKDMELVPTTSSSSSSEIESNNLTNQCVDKRSMSEIILHPRLMTELSNNKSTSSSSEIGVKEERVRRVWLPIARKTAQWFANRETRPPQS